MILAVRCAAGAAAPPAPAATRAPDVVFVPTPQPVVDAMLNLAAVQRGEVVYDLGCGDGRAVITAARDFGARGVGVDIDPQRIAESVANAAAAGVSDQVRFEQADLFQMRFDDADVLFLYLLPQMNARLRPRILQELRPGARVVCHAFAMGEWEPDRHVRVGNIPIFFWVVPARVEGEWTMTLPRGEKGILSLRQKFQHVSGTLTLGGRVVPLRETRLSGASLMFEYAVGWGTTRVLATALGERLTGTIEGGFLRRPQAWIAERR